MATPKKATTQTSKTAARKKAPSSRQAAKKLASPAQSRVKPTPTETATSKRPLPAKSIVKAMADQVPLDGPLTLAEARKLAAATRPRMMANRSLPSEPSATYRSVAQERSKLLQAKKTEIAKRVSEYKETMTILKSRGARGSMRSAAPSGAGRTLVKTSAPKGFVPLQILAEGDSWFDYPPFVIKGGLVPRLERRLGVPILNLAKAGDEVRYMLGVEQYKLLAQHLRDGCPAGGSWDVLLFSGGGNDIVDNPMALWVDEWNPEKPPKAHLNTERFASALSLVRAGYEDLIAMRDRLSPTTLLVFHGYDFAIPDGRGVCFNAAGPWLKPALDLRGFPSQDAGFALVKVMLSEFARMLQALADTHPRVTFVNGQGLLSETTDSWHNELHPSSMGYDRHADHFRTVLKELFPARVI